MAHYRGFETLTFAVVLVATITFLLRYVQASLDHFCWQHFVAVMKMFGIVSNLDSPILGRDLTIVRREIM